MEDSLFNFEWTQVIGRGNPTSQMKLLIMNDLCGEMWVWSEDAQ